MIDYIVIQLIAYVAVLIYGSFFEWTLHRFVMHKRVALVPYPYQLHAVSHHSLFRADESFHAQNEEVKEHVTFVPRDYLILLCINAPIFLLVGYLINVPIVLGGCLSVLTYLAMFDIIHWSFHVPTTWFYEKMKIFKWIKQHHLLHHRHQNRNFNVVFPLADLVLGTLITKPRGEAKVLEI